MLMDSQSIPKTSILLVEDSRVEAKTTKYSLEKIGYDVEWVKNGKSAIKAARTKPIDVILLDLVLPDISGTAVCRYLRKGNITKGIPIIMLTSKDKITDRVAGLAAGANDYLPKPYNDLELNARIYACLRTKSLWNDLHMENKQLSVMLEETKMFVNTDPLTGIFNRSHCEAIIEHEFQRTVRYGFPLSCFMVEIDYLRAKNDNCVPRTGDAILIETAQIIKSSIRVLDVAARWGDKTFFIVLPQTGTEGAMLLAQRLLNKFSLHAFSGLPGRHVSLSIGIASFPCPSVDTGKKLVNAAQRALHDAKRRGRNMAGSLQEKKSDEASGGIKPSNMLSTQQLITTNVNSRTPGNAEKRTKSGDLISG